MRMCGGKIQIYMVILSFFLFTFTSVYANWKENNCLSSATHNANFCSHFFYFTLIFFQAKKEAVPLCFLMKKGLHFHVCISDAHSAQKSAKNDFCFMLHFSYSFGYQYYQGPDHLVPIWIDNNENIYAKMILPKIFWNNS